MPIMDGVAPVPACKFQKTPKLDTDTIAELSKLSDEECWEAYTKHQGKWSTKGAFMDALKIGRYKLQHRVWVY